MEFTLILFIFPLLSFIFGIVGQVLTNKTIIVVSIAFVGWLIATFTIFNSTFLIWVFIYSLLTLVGAEIVYLIKRIKNK